MVAAMDADLFFHVEKLRDQSESEGKWQLRRAFILANYLEVPNFETLISLSRCFVNAKTMQCTYPDHIMKELAELSSRVDTVLQESVEETLKRIESAVGAINIQAETPPMPQPNVDSSDLTTDVQIEYEDIIYENLHRRKLTPREHGLDSNSPDLTSNSHYRYHTEGASDILKKIAPHRNELCLSLTNLGPDPHIEPNKDCRKIPECLGQKVAFQAEFKSDTLPLTDGSEVSLQGQGSQFSFLGKDSETAKNQPKAPLQSHGLGFKFLQSDDYSDSQTIQLVDQGQRFQFKIFGKDSESENVTNQPQDPSQGNRFEFKFLQSHAHSKTKTVYHGTSPPGFQFNFLQSDSKSVANRSQASQQDNGFKFLGLQSTSTSKNEPRTSQQGQGFKFNILQSNSGSYSMTEASPHGHQSGFNFHKANSKLTATNLPEAPQQGCGFGLNFLRSTSKPEKLTTQHLPRMSQQGQTSGTYFLESKSRTQNLTNHLTAPWQSQGFRFNCIPSNPEVETVAYEQGASTQRQEFGFCFQPPTHKSYTSSACSCPIVSQQGQAFGFSFQPPTPKSCAPSVYSHPGVSQQGFGFNFLQSNSKSESQTCQSGSLVQDPGCGFSFLPSDSKSKTLINPSGASLQGKKIQSGFNYLNCPSGILTCPLGSSPQGLGFRFNLFASNSQTQTGHQGPSQPDPQCGFRCHSHSKTQSNHPETSPQGCGFRFSFDLSNSYSEVLTTQIHSEASQQGNVFEFSSHQINCESQVEGHKQKAPGIVSAATKPENSEIQEQHSGTSWSRPKTFHKCRIDAPRPKLPQRKLGKDHRSKRQGHYSPSAFQTELQEPMKLCNEGFSLSPPVLQPELQDECHSSDRSNTHNTEVLSETANGDHMIHTCSFNLGHVQNDYFQGSLEVTPKAAPRREDGHGSRCKERPAETHQNQERVSPTDLIAQIKNVAYVQGFTELESQLQVIHQCQDSRTLSLATSPEPRSVTATAEEPGVGFQSGGLNTRLIELESQLQVIQQCQDSRAMSSAMSHCSQESGTVTATAQEPGVGFQSGGLNSELQNNGHFGQEAKSLSALPFLGKNFGLQFSNLKHKMDCGHCKDYLRFQSRMFKKWHNTPHVKPTQEKLGGKGHRPFRIGSYSVQEFTAAMSSLLKSFQVFNIKDKQAVSSNCGHKCGHDSSHAITGGDVQCQVVDVEEKRSCMASIIKTQKEQRATEGDKSVHTREVPERTWQKEMEKKVETLRQMVAACVIQSSGDSQDRGFINNHKVPERKEQQEVTEESLETLRQTVAACVIQLTQDLPVQAEIAEIPPVPVDMGKGETLVSATHQDRDEFAQLKEDSLAVSETLHHGFRLIQKIKSVWRDILPSHLQGLCGFVLMECESYNSDKEKFQVLKRSAKLSKMVVMYDCMKEMSGFRCSVHINGIEVSAAVSIDELTSRREAARKAVQILHHYCWVVLKKNTNDPENASDEGDDKSHKHTTMEKKVVGTSASGHISTMRKDTTDFYSTAGPKPAEGHRADVDHVGPAHRRAWKDSGQCQPEDLGLTGKVLCAAASVHQQNSDIAFANIPIAVRNVTSVNRPISGLVAGEVHSVSVSSGSNSSALPAVCAVRRGPLVSIPSADFRFLLHPEPGQNNQSADICQTLSAAVYDNHVNIPLGEGTKTVRKTSRISRIAAKQGSKTAMKRTHSLTRLMEVDTETVANTMRSSDILCNPRAHAAISTVNSTDDCMHRGMKKGMEIVQSSDREGRPSAQTPKRCKMKGASLHRPITDHNTGRKLMEKAGWTGGGLGKYGTGMLEPLMVCKVRHDEGIILKPYMIITTSAESKNVKCTKSTLARKKKPRRKSVQHVYCSTSTKPSAVGRRLAAVRFQRDFIAFVSGGIQTPSVMVDEVMVVEESANCIVDVGVCSDDANNTDLTPLLSPANCSDNPLVHAGTSTVHSFGGCMHKGFNNDYLQVINSISAVASDSAEKNMSVAVSLLSEDGGPQQIGLDEPDSAVKHVISEMFDIKEPMPSDEYIFREHFDFCPSQNHESNFERQVRDMLVPYADSGTLGNLIFSPEFSVTERAIIRTVSRALKLHHRSKGKREHCHIHVSPDRSSLQLLAYVVACGGETSQWKVLPPKLCCEKLVNRKTAPMPPQGPELTKKQRLCQPQDDDMVRQS